MKRNLLVFSMFLGSAFSLISCGENSKKENETITVSQENEPHESKIEGTDPTSTAEFKDEKMQTVYNDYQEIKTAFIDSDAQKAKDAADKLAKNISSDDYSDIKDAAQKIARESDINKQRETFSELTAAIGEKLDGALASGEIYKMYCPMAFQGKGGYWYNNSKQVRNPYYGDKMFTCGRVDATFK